MNTPKHTPGPWSVVDAPDDTRFVSPDPHFSIQDPQGVTVALVFAEVKRDWLNCTLIASAPELLEALKYIANKAETLAGWKLDPKGHDVTISELLELEQKARAAIAKAEGVQ